MSNVAADAERRVAPVRSESVLSSPRIPAVAFQNVVGSSPAIRRAIDLGIKVAAHPLTTVLIHGETGTGKELFARGIHYSSPNAGEPFVAINCAAIPEHLLESELFGHEQGAFTGADTKKRGLLEFAGHGTVFLDEIGELPASLQAKMLRALEERKIRSVGGLHEIDIRCRIIAATNRDLQNFVNDGFFRNDLFYRLSVFQVELPPLRDRQGDVEVLTRFFLDSICREHGSPSKRISADALDVLRRYAWPGNVRELKNVLEGALILCEGDVLRPEHIVLRRRSSERHEQPAASEPDGMVIRIPKGGLTLSEIERQLLITTLGLANFNQSQAARMLGVSRPTIVRMMEKHGVQTRRQLISDSEK